MRYHILFIAFVYVCFTGLVAVSLGQEAVTSSKESISASDANEAKALSFPYIAQITEENVYVRSGPGTNHYPCGKLGKVDKVRVVGSQFGWSRIVCPAGSFSWISKQHVETDPNNPDIGTVTGDGVRVYAGSDDIKPIHSTAVQLKLNTGDKVKLIGEGIGGYYKIVPPVGAYLWVSTQYTSYLGPTGQVPLTVEPQPEPNTIEVIPVRASVEAEKLEAYYALQQRVEAERAKPMNQQNYADIKKALAEIAGDKGAGKAARYSEFAINQIERFELALGVDKEIQLQNSQLQQIQQRIDKACAAELAEVPNLGRFAVIGQFQYSIAYSPEPELIYCRIVDDSGKTICYALPSGFSPEMDFSKFIGRKVGLVGQIEPHPQTAGALVRFTEITELK